MKPYTRFHYFYSLQYIRYALLLSVVPLIRALILFDLPSLFTALKQDGIIFICVMGFAVLQWLASGYRCSHGRIISQEGLLMRRQLTVSRPMIAALELRRPVHCQLFGACIVSVYFKHSAKPVVFYLTRKDAQNFADELLPLNRQDDVFRPVGAERLSFSVLSANLITTGFLVAMSAKKTSEMLGNGLNQFAVSNFEKIEKMAEQIFPVGVAWIASFIFILASIAFLFSFVHTAGFVVCRNGGVIVAKGGLITKTERRILASAVTACDIRTTPVARILRHSAVYLHAGGFAGKDLPLMVYKQGTEHRLQKLMPEFFISKSKVVCLHNRSLVQFIWLPGSFFLFFLGLTSVSGWMIPQLTPLLAIPTFLFFLSVFLSLEGFFTASVQQSSNRTIELCYSKFLTKHRVCIFTSNCGFSFSTNPFLTVRKQCNLNISLPCHMKFRVRAVSEKHIKTLPFLL